VWSGVVLTCGSGKSGMPWLRMHAAYLNAAVAPSCGVLGLGGEEDPQPAASSTRLAINTARGTGPSRRAGAARALLGAIGCLVCIASATSLDRRGGSRQL